ncbi:MAG: hypothetical protein ABJQ29_15095 [Luteolibacter sp.]
MKCFIFILFFIYMTVGLGSGEELPGDVQRLFDKRNEAVTKIDRIFVNELEKLKLKYTRNGDLDSAISIVALIEKFRIEEDDFEPLSEVYGKSFSWSVNGEDYGNRIIIFEGGSGTFGGMAITWKKISERKVRLSFASGNPEIEWSPDCKSFSGMERGGRVVGRLIE